MGRRIPFESVVKRLALGDKNEGEQDGVNESSSMTKTLGLGFGGDSVLFGAGNRKINDKWRMQQQVFRAAIKAAR